MHGLIDQMPNWYPWLKKELEIKGYTVYLPEIPTMNSNTPNLQTQIKFIEKYIPLDKNFIVFGHSLGALLAMRLAEKYSFAIMFLVSGWDFDDLSVEHKSYWKIKMKHALKARTLNQQLPNNVALDSAGNLTTDPNDALKGATLAFNNSYKGSGLAMMVEILSGVLPGADFVGKNPEGGWGNIFMAFSPELLQDLDTFKDKTRILIETVRNSKTKDGNKVRIVGENTLNERDKNLQSGIVDIDEKLFNELKNIAQA